LEWYWRSVEKFNTSALLVSDGDVVVSVGFLFVYGVVHLLVPFGLVGVFNLLLHHHENVYEV
jgi:hypothetical protein